MIEPRSGDRIYVDSNAFIYVVENYQPFAESLRAFFAQCAAKRAVLVTSELTIAECLYRPFRERHAAFIRDYDDLFASDDVEIVELRGQVARYGAEIGGALRLKLLDAIHYASALQAGCSTFVSYDLQYRSRPGLRLLTPGKDASGN